MEGVHVAHDTIVGNGCIIGNQTKMAGEVIIDDNAIVSGVVLMHQFCHVGSYVMIQAVAVSAKTYHLISLPEEIQLLIVASIL